MKIEIIAIGDELTSGQRLDTNTQWLSQQLVDIGLRANWHTTVGDDIEDKMASFEVAAVRANLVIITGGLGPTEDDLTREVMAKTAGVELELDEGILAEVCARWERRGRKMPERNRVQALFPTGSCPIPNPHGTAPGIDMSITSDSNHACRMFALPGVPAEMKEMWDETVRPAIDDDPNLPTQVIVHRSLKCFGEGESDVEKKLPNLIRRGREPLVGITASKATITLRITATAETRENCDAQISETEKEIREILGPLVYGVENEELHDVVAAQLHDMGLRIACVESATAGLVSQWMNSTVSGSDVFAGGLVLDSMQPNWQVAIDPSGSAKGLASENDIVSVARQVRDRFNAAIGLVIGPMPPSSENRSQPDAIAMALCDDRGAFEVSHPIGGHPEIIVPRAAKQAIDLIRRRLMKTASKSTD